MSTDVVFYTNESFLDVASRQYQVARIERDVAGYDVVALWHTAEQARAHVDKLNAQLGVNPDDVLTVVASSMAKSNALREQKVDTFDVVMPMRFTMLTSKIADLKARAIEVDGTDPRSDYSIAEAFIVVLHNDPEWLFNGDEGRLVGWTSESEWPSLPTDGEILAS